MAGVAGRRIHVTSTFWRAGVTHAAIVSKARTPGIGEMTHMGYIVRRAFFREVGRHGLVAVHGHGRVSRARICHLSRPVVKLPTSIGLGTDVDYGAAGIGMGTYGRRCRSAAGHSQG